MNGPQPARFLPAVNQTLKGRYIFSEDNPISGERSLK